MAEAEKKARRRATEAERQKRIGNVLTMRARGVLETQIVQSLMQSEGLSKRQAERYVEECQRIFAGLGDRPSNEERGLLLNRIDIIFAEVMFSENKDISIANSILGNAIKVYEAQQKFLKGGHSGECASSVAIESLTPELAELLETFEEIGEAE